MPRKWKNRAPKIKAAKSPPADRRDKPREFRCAGAGLAVTVGQPIEAADGQEKKLGRFEGNAYTGAEMRPMGWWDKVIIDLAGVRTPQQHRPVLRQHDHEQIVGHTESITVDREKGILIAGILSGQQEHVDKVAVPASNGFQWQLSIGADPIRTEFLEPGEEAEVNGRPVTGPMTISRETELGEISFVPLGADGDTSATVAAQRGTETMPFKLALKKLLADLRAAGKVKAAKYSDDEVEKMSEDEAKAALKKCMAEDDVDAADDDDDDDDEEGDDKPPKSSKKNRLAFNATKAAQEFQAELRKIQAAEQQRVSAITALCRQYQAAEVELDDAGKKVKVDLAQHATLSGWTLDQVKAALLDHVRSQRPGPGVGIPGGLGYATSTPEANEAVLEAAVLHACRHQMLLQDDEFYFDRAPDGTKIRRVPQYLQKEAQDSLRLRYTDQVQQAAHTIFKGRIGLQQLLATALEIKGSRERIDWRSDVGIKHFLATWDHLEPQHLRAEGASNMSISNILANVLNKFALQGYLFGEQSWREVCAIRPVNDFKPVKSINLLGQAMFQQVGSSSELKNFAFGDQAFSNQAAPFGIIGTIPYTHLVNDDLSMLSGAPQKIGQGAILALNDNIWTLWAAMAAGTVNGDDGNAFWRTGSATSAQNKQQGKAYQPNKTSGGGSALSSSSLKTAKALFDNQVDPNGNPLGFDGMMPTLLFGPSNWVTATELVRYRELIGTGQTTTPKQPDGNVWAGTMKPVMSRYIENANYVNSTTAFWVLFNPVALAVIEACFLNGVDTPAVLQAGPDYQFDRLGISIRGTMSFGSNQQNFRGGVYSVGA